MRIGSLFDGSGGFPLAGVISGMEPVWASEIEPYPMKVTAARFPQMKQLGDVTKINGAEIEPVDVITFGSPCQDLSVAGKQAGIHNGERSSLFFEAVRIIKEMRANDIAAGRTAEHVRPRFAVWENVPGAYSSNKGQDFRAVLQALAEVAGGSDIYVPMPEKGKWNKAGCIVGYGWSIAWRTYDAQYWGVPQRRKRIYLIADFGSERAGEILFKRESVRGNFETSIEAWKNFTANAAGSVVGSCADGRAIIAIDQQGGKGGANFAENVMPTICSDSHGTPHAVAYQNTVGALCMDDHKGQNSQYVGQNKLIVCFEQKSMLEENWKKTNIKHAIRANESKSASAVVYESHPMDSRVKECGSISPTVTTKYAKGTADTPLVVHKNTGNGTGNIVPTLTGDHQNRVTDYTSVICGGNGQLGGATGADIANTLDCMHDQQFIVGRKEKPPRKYIVRRRTPLECCRLQGFPDWWEDGVEGSDSARYKMWGNGIALPCAVDVLWRIAHA